MNVFNKRVYALLMTMAVAAVPVYGVENEEMEGVASEQASEVVASTPWYKERSTQIVAAVMTCVGIYTAAVYMNKLSSPVALWRNLFTPIVPHNNSTDVPCNNSTDTSSNTVSSPNSNSTITSNMVDIKNDVLSDTTITIDQGDNVVIDNTVVTDTTIDTKNDVSTDATIDKPFMTRMTDKLAKWCKAGFKRFDEFNDAWNKRSVE